MNINDFKSFAAQYCFIKERISDVLYEIQPYNEDAESLCGAVYDVDYSEMSSIDFDLLDYDDTTCECDPILDHTGFIVSRSWTVNTSCHCHPEYEERRTEVCVPFSVLFNDNFINQQKSLFEAKQLATIEAERKKEEQRIADIEKMELQYIELSKYPYVGMSRKDIDTLNDLRILLAKESGHLKHLTFYDATRTLIVKSTE